MLDKHQSKLLTFFYKSYLRIVQYEMRVFRTIIINASDFEIRLKSSDPILFRGGTLSAVGFELDSRLGDTNRLMKIFFILFLVR